MPIIIRNITNNPTKTGPNEYGVWVNDKLITKYSHNRQDGLAMCLNKASLAVWDETVRSEVGGKIDDN